MNTPEDEHLQKLARYLDLSGISDYVQLAQRPGKLLFLNFISGVARGLGFTVGTAIVLAFLYKLVAEIISMNIPYLTELLSEFIGMMHAAGG